MGIGEWIGLPVSTHLHILKAPNDENKVNAEQNFRKRAKILLQYSNDTHHGAVTV
jgi:hypothetical protein